MNTGSHRLCDSVMIDFTHIFVSIPRPGSTANGLSEVLFKTRHVQGGSDISALRATGRTGLFQTGEYQELLWVQQLPDSSPVLKDTFSLTGISCERHESLANPVSVLSGLRCSCAVCDVRGRGARWFYFWWVANPISSTFTLIKFNEFHVQLFQCGQTRWWGGETEGNLGTFTHGVSVLMYICARVV